MEKGLRLINYTLIKIFNILVGVQLAFAGTIVVLSNGLKLLSYILKKALPLVIKNESK